MRTVHVDRFWEGQKKLSCRPAVVVRDDDPSLNVVFFDGYNDTSQIPEVLVDNATPGWLTSVPARGDRGMLTDDVSGWFWHEEGDCG